MTISPSPSLCSIVLGASGSCPQRFFVRQEKCKENEVRATQKYTVYGDLHVQNCLAKIRRL